MPCAWKACHRSGLASVTVTSVVSPVISTPVENGRRTSALAFGGDPGSRFVWAAECCSKLPPKGTEVAVQGLARFGTGSVCPFSLFERSVPDESSLEIKHISAR